MLQVAVLQNRLFCVGGAQQTTGVAAMKTCQVYDPEQNTWSHTTQLATGKMILIRFVEETSLARFVVRFFI